MQLTFVNCGKKSGKNLTFTAAENGSCTQLEREVRGKIYKCHISEMQQSKFKSFVREC